jgi:hypothetical protein
LDAVTATLSYLSSTGAAYPSAAQACGVTTPSPGDGEARLGALVELAIKSERAVEPRTRTRPDAMILNPPRVADHAGARGVAKAGP